MRCWKLIDRMAYPIDFSETVNDPERLAYWKWWENFENRRVKRTYLYDGEIEVSTVFLGIDHQFGEGPPLLFETMIFGSNLNEAQWRCSTWKEAEQQHSQAVDACREAIRIAQDSNEKG